MKTILINLISRGRCRRNKITQIRKNPTSVTSMECKITAKTPKNFQPKCRKKYCQNAEKNNIIYAEVKLNERI